MSNTISPSLITSAPSASPSSSKADQSNSSTVDGQFSGLLNQALQGQQSEHPDASQSQANNTTENQSQAATTSDELQHTADQSPAKAHSQDNKTDDTENNKTDIKRNDKAELANDPTLLANAQLLGLPLQPLNLTILHSAHLIGQTSTITSQAGKPGESGTPPASAQTSITATGIGRAFPATANTLAFAQPTSSKSTNDSRNTVVDSAIAQTDGQTALPDNGQITPDLLRTKDGFKGQAGTNIPTAAGSTPKPTEQKADSTHTLSLLTPASSEGATSIGDLARQATAPLEGLNQGQNPDISQNLNPSQTLSAITSSGLANIKPNASLPGADTFKKTLNSLHSTLDTLHGEVESVSNGASGKGSKETDSLDNLINRNNHNADPLPSASDVLTTASLNTAPATGSADSGNDNGIPQFSSLAPNPTEQVAEGMAYTVKNGHKELIIKLNPDNLGEVRVSLTSHGNQELSARLIASTTESRDLLRGQLDSLKSTLEAQGITVDRLSVILAGSAESSNNNTHSHQQHAAPQQEQQQQQNTQQGSTFQQQFNQQNPSGAALFNQMQGQMNGQSQPNRAQHTANNAETDVMGINHGQNAEPQPITNSNGRISILA